MKHTSNAPFLTTYATPRVPAAETPGYYSPEQEMWVVQVNGNEEPLIEQNTPAISLVTKTLTQQETDDQADTANFAGILTKTNTYHERDDEGSFSVLEMATKTEAQLERDDTDPEMTKLFI